MSRHPKFKSSNFKITVLRLGRVAVPFSYALALQKVSSWSLTAATRFFINQIFLTIKVNDHGNRKKRSSLRRKN